MEKHSWGATDIIKSKIKRFPFRDLSPPQVVQEKNATGIFHKVIVYQNSWKGNDQSKSYATHT